MWAEPWHTSFFFLAFDDLSYYIFLKENGKNDKGKRRNILYYNVLMNGIYEISGNSRFLALQPPLK